MQKPLTKQELKDLPNIDEKDKARIEDVIDVTIGSDYSGILILALRGYLASQLLELEVNDEVRAELGSDSACFIDGWRYCMEFGDPSTMFLYKSKK